MLAVGKIFNWQNAFACAGVMQGVKLDAQGYTIKTVILVCFYLHLPVRHWRVFTGRACLRCLPIA